MPDKIFVVTQQDEIYFFEKEESLFEFLNEEGEYEPEFENERNNWKVLPEFPAPHKEGSYCPFTHWNPEATRGIWPQDGVVVLWNGRIVHLKKHTITREVKGFAYGPTPQSKGAKARWAKKQSALETPKKATKKRGGRPRKAA